MKKQAIFCLSILIFYLSLPVQALTAQEEDYIQKFLSSTPKEQLQSIRVLKSDFSLNTELVLEHLIRQNLTFNVQVFLLGFVNKKNIQSPGVQTSMVHLLNSPRTLLKIKDQVLSVLNNQLLSQKALQSLTFVVTNENSPLSIRKGALTLLAKYPDSPLQFSHILMKVISESIHKLSGPYANSPFFLKTEASKFLHRITDPSLFASFLKSALNTPNNLVKDTALRSLYHLPVPLHSMYDDLQVQNIIISTILKETNTKTYSQLFSVLAKAKKLNPSVEEALAKILTDKNTPPYAKKEGLKGFSHLSLSTQADVVTHILLHENNKSLQTKLFKVLNQTPPARDNIYGSKPIQKVMTDVAFHTLHASPIRVKSFLFLLKAAELSSDFMTYEFQTRMVKLVDLSSYTNPYLTEAITLFVPYFKDALLQKKVILSALTHKNSFVIQSILKVLYHKRANINSLVYQDKDIQKQLVTMGFFPHSLFEQKQVFDVLELVPSVDPEVKAVLTKAAHFHKDLHRQMLAQQILKHLRVFSQQALPCKIHFFKKS